MRKFLILALLLGITGLLPLISLAAPAGEAAASTSTPATSTPATSSPATSQMSSAQMKRLAKLDAQILELFKAGKFAAAKQLLVDSTKEFPDNEVMWYNLACANSLLGDKNAAFQCLNTAVAKGYCDFLHLERDEDLVSLRNLPEYRKLLDRREQVQNDRAKNILVELKKQYGQDYICEIVPKDSLVVATNVDRQTLDRMKERLTLQAEALWNDLFPHKFDQYVTVIISRTDSANMNGIGGYYMNALHMLVAKTVGMTLHHEFTHALHFADQDALGQTHPIWITEGLASLFESSDIVDGHIKPVPNNRLNFLKGIVSQKRTIPWREMMKYNQLQFMKPSRVGISYSQVRYMMMYLYETGKLREWYKNYTDNYQTDSTGALAIEKTFGKDVDKVEADWLAWVAKTPAPPVMLPPNHACIGIRVEPETDGLEVADVVAGSGADKAGLKTKDVIVSIDGRDMVEPGDLIMLVDGHQVGDVLKLRYRRGKVYSDATVALGAMPQSAWIRPARSRPATTTKTTTTTSTTSRQVG